MEPLVPHLWNVTSLEESFGLCTSLVWLENSDVFQKSFSHTVLSGVPQTVNVSISMSAEDVCLNRLKNWWPLRYLLLPLLYLLGVVRCTPANLQNLRWITSLVDSILSELVCFLFNRHHYQPLLLCLCALGSVVCFQHYPNSPNYFVLYSRVVVFLFLYLTPPAQIGIESCSINHQVENLHPVLRSDNCCSVCTSFLHFASTPTSLHEKPSLLLWLSLIAFPSWSANPNFYGVLLEM